MKTSKLTVVLLLAAGFAQAAEYHVAKDGKNENTGSEEEPFLTIQHAADLAQPGDVITVHEGVYRERINPPRGGTSDDTRITYQAAHGEEVVIKGSEVVSGWEKVQDDVWTVVLPNSVFGDFNPYTDVIGGEWHRNNGYPRHTGTVYLNGNWLDEAPNLEHVLPPRKPTAGTRADSKDEVLGGRVAKYPGKAVAGTEEDILYQTCRYNLGGYRLAVPNGTYRVILKFCEPHFDSKAQRVFDVKLQGSTVLKDFDLLAKVDPFAAHDETFDGIEVTDGRLKIDIVNRVSMACISGIAVDCGEYSKKINCGGPEWKTYQRDPAPAASAAHGRPLWFAKVDEENTTIWAQFRDVDPNAEMVEINVRQSVFYPDKTGRDYITVHGLTMRQAATPWSGAMSEQIGLIGTHWSKGWIIEDNVISHSMNTGITLGRYDLGKFGIALPAVSAPGFVESCELALAHGWSKENIGSHVVRNNHISHCGKNGIHGSLGGVFSTIEGNTICDIAMRGWIGGPDVAGLKLLGSLDVVIRHNHIYRCGGAGGVWLDWMAQGTRVTGNLLHDNRQDIFVEVNHGPLLIDNNLFLSGGIKDLSQGLAYVHNLITGGVVSIPQERRTPYFKPHTVEHMKLSDIRNKDARYYNNLFIGDARPPSGDSSANVHSAGNAHLHGSGVKVEEKADGVWIELPQADAATDKKRPLVTTELLGKAAIPGAAFEQPDGTPYRIDTDYFGKKRTVDNPAPGPFRWPGEKRARLKVWPKR